VIDIVKKNLKIVKKVVEDFKAEQAKKAKEANEAKKKANPLKEAA
jgi:hypothetical protein